MKDESEVEDDKEDRLLELILGKLSIDGKEIIPEKDRLIILESKNQDLVSEATHKASAGDAACRTREASLGGLGQAKPPNGDAKASNDHDQLDQKSTDKSKPPDASDWDLAVKQWEEEFAINGKTNMTATLFHDRIKERKMMDELRKEKKTELVRFLESVSRVTTSDVDVGQVVDDQILPYSLARFMDKNPIHKDPECQYLIEQARDMGSMANAGGHNTSKFWQKRDVIVGKKFNTIWSPFRAGLTLWARKLIATLT